MAENKTKKKIKVAFPHMGNIYVAWGSALRRLGVEPYIPPYSSKRTLSLGTKNSPESICLPYKLILGNFIEAIEGGADYVAMISSPGICRLGEYGAGIQNTLEDMGYHANYVELQLYDGIKGMFKFFSELSGVKNPISILRAIAFAFRKVFAADRMETLLAYYRAREVKSGTSERAFKEGMRLIYEANHYGELKKAEKLAIKGMKKIEIDPNRDVLYVDLTGEIYIVQDPFSNQNIERELGKMGVQTRRTLTISSFLKDAIIPKIFVQGETHLERSFRLAKPYLRRDIGGDSLECVSDIIFANENGKDGIIHISPFTCMPEIMSQNFFPSMRENCEIPILPLIMDEQSGKAGYITRLEAFVDLMRRRKRKREKKVHTESSCG